MITFQGDGTGLDNSGSPYYNQAKCGPVYITSSSTNSVLQYVTVDALGFGSYYVTDDSAAVDIGSTSCSITNCNIQAIRGTGILFENSSSKSVTSNSFSNNRIALKIRNTSPLINLNNFSSSTYLDVVTGFDNLNKLQGNNLLSSGIGLTADIAVSKNDTMAAIAANYVLLEANTIPSGKTLTIQPGILFKFPAVRYGGLSLTINGTLIAKGTPTSYVTFQGDGTGLDNGGSPYYNQAECGPVYITSSSTNSVFQYVTVDALGFGSYYVTDNTAALDISSASCSITNCNIQNIRGTGVLLENTSTKPITSNTFSNNRVSLKLRNSAPLINLNSFSSTYLDVITGLDNLNKLQGNDFLSDGIGLTADIPVAKNDTMTAITAKYVLLEAITVPSGKTLDIQPGITFVFPPVRYGGITLNIDGTLVAIGTAASYITFQGDGNALDNGGSPYYNQAQCGPLYISASSLNSTLQYVTVDALGFGSYYVSDNTAALDVSSTSCSITNCNIQNVRGTGVLLENSSSKPIKSNSFSNNRVGLKLKSASPLISTNNFSSTYLDVITGLDNLNKLQGNDYLNNGIGLTADITMGKNDTMAAIAAKYVLLAAITVPSGKTLTIQPGITFVFPPVRYGGLTLTINGTIIAKGTYTSNIIFQGDANALGNGGSPYYNQAVCGPVYISSSSLNSYLQYVSVESLGFGTYYQNDSTAAIYVGSNSCKVFNCNINSVGGTGITIQKASPDIEVSCFNTCRGGTFSNGGKARLFRCNFVGNSSFGVKNIGITDSVDATNCYWNSPSGPSGGDNVVGNVKYNPFSPDAYDCSDTTLLPVSLLNFKAAYTSSGTINCTWQTAQETNTNYFNIQRSTNALSFSNIGRVTASGNSTTIRSYNYVDDAIANLGVSKLYYRLQEVDKDGKSTYSNIQLINITKNSPLFTVSPNPANDYINIVSTGNAGAAQISITDMNGRTLYTGKQNFSGNQQIKIPVQQFAKQVLVVTIITDNGKQQVKVVKQ